MKDNLNTLQIASKFMPHLLRKEKKNNHVTTCQDLPDKLEGGPEFLLKIIIYEEKQDYKHNAETKQH